MTSEIKAKTIEMVPIEKLVDNPRNNNKHSVEQIERLAKLIKHTGFRNPVVVSNRTGFLVAGHGRKDAALKIGMTKIPVTYQDFESEAEEYQYLTADNEIARWAELDSVALFDNIKELGLEDSDLELFGLPELELPEIKMLDEENEDEVPTDVDTRCKPGDVWLLGEHRLMCGDSTSIDAVEKLMGGEKADMVFTDPPYGVDYTGGHNKVKREGIQGDKLEGDDLTDLFAESLSNAEIVSTDNAAFYIWYANGKAVETFKSFSTLNLSVRAVICWYKVRSGLGAFMSQYIPNYEPCIYAFKEGCSPNWYGPTDEKTVWELQKESKNDYHPTQKPIALPERAINNSSKAGNNVLDVFGGSGSTLVACEKTNRKCFMMELDPHYCDIILARWEKYTSKTAELIDGPTT